MAPHRTVETNTTTGDIPFLKEAGIKEIFTPGTTIEEIIQWVKDNIKPRD